MNKYYDIQSLMEHSSNEEFCVVLVKQDDEERPAVVFVKKELVN